MRRTRASSAPCRRCSKPCSRCEAIRGGPGVGTTASFMTQSLIDLRRQLDDLQRQISTGEKVVSYSGISPQSQLLIGLNSQLNAVSGFHTNNNVVGRRLTIAQTALTQFDSTAQSVGDSARLSSYKPGANGQTIDQLNAGSQPRPPLSPFHN